MIAVPKYALGRLSSQANNSMGYVRIFARAVSNHNEVRRKGRI